MNAGRKSASYLMWTEWNRFKIPPRKFQDVEIVPRGCLSLAISCRDRALRAARVPFCETEARIERQEMRVWAKRWRLRTETVRPAPVARQSVFSEILREAAL